MTTRILFKILNTARFPLEYSRGSESARFKKSRKLSEMFLKELENTEEYSNEFILDSIKKVLTPYNIQTRIEPNNLNRRGGHRNELEIIRADKNEFQCAHTGHILYFDTNLKKRDKYTILHEAGHLFDSALNPKSLRADYIKLYDKKKIYENTQQIKTKFASIIKMKELKSFTNKSAETIPNEYLIDTLQNIRYTLKTEMNQYKFGLKQMLYDKNIDLITLINEAYLYYSLKYSSKLKFADKLLKEELLKAKHRLVII